MSGTVTLDAAKLGSSDAHDAGLVLLHELGHLVGLAHVTDRRQVMFPALQPAQRSYGPGDLAGLAALGRGPCEPDS